MDRRILLILGAADINAVDMVSPLLAALIDTCFWDSKSETVLLYLQTTLPLLIFCINENSFQVGAN